ncbi:MAG: DUF4349 domain-containing protein [Chloroflexi bacterium]|nr:DUF4349 domain-containing protein [Chloroflexota bacterium]
MSRLLLLIMLGLGALLAVACAASGERGSAGAPERPSFAPAPAAQAPAASKGAFSNVGESSGSDTSGLTPASDRLIIRNGQISLVVADLDASLQAVTSLAPELGGFVVNSNRSGQEGSAFAQITIRVPSEKFDLALERLRRVGQRVESESTQSQDVTEEYVDLQARLRNLQATEKQFVTLLDRANTVEDVLKVQRELGNVRSEIERLQGRIQYLERSGAYSLITVSLRPASSPAPIVNPRWSLLETIREASRGLVENLQGMATLAIWVAVFTPLWLPVAVLLSWGAWRWRRRARRAGGAAGRTS